MNQSGLDRFGITGSTPKVRKVETSKASTDPDVPTEHLKDAQIRDLTTSFPWAVYSGASNRSAAGKAQHLWSCTICEEAGSDRIEKKWKDANDSKQHTSLRQHKQACDAKAAAAAMQHAREQGAITRVSKLVLDSSKFLVLVDFMVRNDLALQLFPKV
jgi:hypothetical protein